MADLSRNSSAVDEQLKKHGLHLDDNDQICWNEDNKDHPRNWSTFTKCYNNAIIIWLEFLMTAVSTSGVSRRPSFPQLTGIDRSTDFGSRFSTYRLWHQSDIELIRICFDVSSLINQGRTMLPSSRYLIGQTMGGIFCSPISETFGRRTLYIASALVFCIFNAITAAVPSIIAVFFGRFITGFVAAIPATMAFGNFSDTHDWEVRIWIVYFYTLLGNCGLVIGPIYSAYIVESVSWRWVFYVATIASGISAVAAFGMKESRATSLLDQRVELIKKETGYDKLKIESSGKKLTFKSFLQDSLFRPLQFLVTQPIVTFCAILCSIAYGLIYGSTESLTIVYEQFGWSQASTSLAFIPILLGLVLDIVPRFWDQHILNKHKKQNRMITPETKIASFAIACPALTIGLWIFGWTVPPLVHTHWIVSMIGLLLIGFAANDFSYVLFGYVTDLYGPYAASAVSSLSLSRTLVAAAFPLFTTQMYEGLNANYATTILAGIATLFAFTPFIFLRFAPKFKKMSSFVEDSDENENEKNGRGDIENGGSTVTGNEQ